MKRIFTLALLLLSCAGMLHAQQNDTVEALRLHDQAIAFAQQGDMEKSRQCGYQAFELRKNIYGEYSEQCVSTLNNIALTYYFEENYPKAVEVQEQAMRLMKKLKKPAQQAGDFLLNMARFYYFADDYAHCAPYVEQGLPYVEKFSKEYEVYLEMLGMCYDELHDEKGQMRVMALMEEHNQHELTLPCETLPCMVDRAQYFAATGDNDHAREWFNRALALSLSDSQQVALYKPYAQFLSAQMRDFLRGAEYLGLAAQAQQRIDGDMTEAVASLLYSQAQYLYLGKQYEQGAAAYQQVAQFYASRHRGNLMRCLDGQSNCLQALRDYEGAIPLRSQVLDYYTHEAPDKAQQARAVVRLATSEKFAKRYDESIGHYRKGLDLYRELGDEEAYAETVSSLNLCYLYAGRSEREEYDDSALKAKQRESLESIIRETSEGLDIAQQYLGGLTYAQSLGTIAGCHAMLERYDKAVNYYEKYITALRNAIRDEFRLSDESTRMRIWKEHRETIDEMLNMMLELPEGQNKLLANMGPLAYDAKLLSKGILLNSSVEFGRLLAQTSPELQQRYQQTRDNNARIEQLRRNITSLEDAENIRRLMRENESLQQELYRGCSEYADFTNYISYTWKDVRNALGPKDVAIEFAAIDPGVYGEDGLMVALVLTRETKKPAVVGVLPLSVVRAMERDSNLLLNPQVGEWVWSPIQPYLDNKRRVFFSADGLFNSIAIEYLTYGTGHFCDQYEAYRLSSTKELCYRRAAQPLERIALFGDIAYAEFGESNDHTQSMLAALRNGALPNELNELPDTKREIDGIASLARHHALAASPFSQQEASREAFLQLSGSRTDIIHIATHGLVLRSAQASSEEESMRSSLLAFAGANLTDDQPVGMVTAADVAEMDLRKCDLVVLSACETGLGKLSDDGVFGLQRGFKNAGAHSLVMSLKPVYDHTTADLMLAFYRHLLDGSTKQQALRQAQAELRQQGYSHPKYWATFILLDALD